MSSGEVIFDLCFEEAVGVGQPEGKGRENPREQWEQTLSSRRHKTARLELWGGALEMRHERGHGPCQEGSCEPIQ